ncbi:MAG: IS1380 family transposase [Xanthobacteraceae bacterium]
MTDNKLPTFSFPAVSRKPVIAAFDGGRLTSDGGVMLLSMAERRLGIAERLARCFPDRRHPLRITHTLADMIRARVFAISCGYEDADDLDFLRTDPAFKLACGRLPDSGADLCSQPTLSRLENAPSLKDAIRLTYALVDQWQASYPKEPPSIIFDIDDTCDVAHGHQQLSLFNAHYDQRCFLPIHVYDTDRSRPVAVVLRPGKTPGGVEVRAHLRRLVRRVRTLWSKTRITFRGDGHYARPEAMEWCEANDIDYIFGLPGSRPLSKKVDETADSVRTERAVSDRPVVRGYCETRHKAKSWGRERRVVARVEATPLGLDTRFVVTNIEHGSAEWIYDSLYCARGQAENLIKLHKSQLASDRTSCRSAIANQVRLVLHTAADWLMLTVRDAIPKPRELACAEFATLRLRLIKIAARVIETASRVRLAFAACCSEADLFQGLPGALAPLGP